MKTNLLCILVAICLTFATSEIAAQEKQGEILHGVSESFVKEFVPMDLGVIHLEKGKRPLVLSAPKIPGKQSIEMRLIMLNRISTTSIPVSEDALK